MNKQYYKCLAGLDDGYFLKRRGAQTILAMVGYTDLTSIDKSYPFTIAIELIEVDGIDATLKAINLASKLLTKCKNLVLLTDTLIYAGFNILDPQRLREEVNVSVISVHRYEPDKAAIEHALRKHFRDADNRLRILKDEWGRLRRISCRRGHLYIAVYGLSLEEAWTITCKSQLYSREPEPIYQAGLIASTLSRKLIYKNL